MRKFFAVVFLLLFWLSLFLSLVFVSIRYSLFSPDYLKNALSESNFYSQVTDLVVEDYLDEDVIDKEVASQAFTSEWLEQSLVTIIDAVYGQLLLDAQFSDLEEVYIDVSGPKDALVPMLAEYFTSAFTIDLTAAFTQDQVSQALDSALPDQLNLMSTISFFSEGQSVLTSPDPNEQFSFLDVLGEKTSSDSEFFTSFQSQIETFKNLRLIVVFVMYVCIALAILSLLALALLFIFRKPSLLSWMATSTLPPGIGAFALAGIAKIYLMFNQSYLEKNADEFMAQAGEFANPKITLLSVDFLYAYLHPILNRVIIFGLILLVLGILFLVLRKVIHKSAK